MKTFRLTVTSVLAGFLMLVGTAWCNDFYASSATELDLQLFAAVKAKDPTKVKSLLSQGANVNAKKEVGHTLLSTAIIFSPEIAKLLVEDYFADVNVIGYGDSSPLHTAAQTSDDMTKLLLEKGANPNVIENVNGFTPLHWAICRNRLGIARLLLERGANPYLCGENAIPPIHYAAEKDRVEILTRILDYGYDLNARSGFNSTPLHIAIAHCSYKCVRLLLERGADVNLCNNDGETPLHIAVANIKVLDWGKKDYTIIYWLFEKDVRLDIVDIHGNTPLYAALSHLQPNIAAWLIKVKGAQLNPGDRNTSLDDLAYHHRLRMRMRRRDPS